jgi:5'-3' exonuclease
MIILDLSRVLIAAVMAESGGKPVDVDEDIIRHTILNCIRVYKKQFEHEYGELVIACDGKDYWRKRVFPYYKANRKKDRDESGLDWDAIFKSLHKIRDEIAEYFPYKTILVDDAEADDVIAVLAKEYHLKEKVMIVSVDKDLLQLQKYANVDQYSPYHKKNLKIDNPEHFLSEQILKGDRSDGVPNVQSSDSCLIMGIRQKSMTAKLMEKWVMKKPEIAFAGEKNEEELLRNYKRNQEMIDLDFIPESVSTAILEQFTSQKKTRMKLFSYFITHKLKNLMSDLQDF